jgi:hypothetical protein
VLCRLQKTWAVPVYFFFLQCCVEFAYSKFPVDASTVMGITGLNCLEGETSLQNCSYNVSSSPQCSTDYVAGVICYMGPQGNTANVVNWQINRRMDGYSSIQWINEIVPSMWMVKMPSKRFFHDILFGGEDIWKTTLIARLNVDPNNPGWV